MMPTKNSKVQRCIVLIALIPCFVNSFANIATQQRLSTMLQVKHNERAFIDKKLEDLMDNDWREFRAQLVAKEQAEAQEVPYVDADDCDVARQGMLSGMFADAISSIFSGRDRQRRDLFDGKNIGNYVPKECIPEDPFVSQSELPSFMQPKATIDKHRWAHSIPYVEPGCVLVASEHLGGVFHQTVVLIVDHNESQGTIGIVINRPLQGKLKKVSSTPLSNIDLSLKLAFGKSDVTYGGPVCVDDYSIIHGYGEVEGARKLASGVFVGGSGQLIDEVRLGLLSPKDVLFVKGHASWTGGQLQRELAKKVWYPASVSRDLILRYAGAPTTDEDDVNDLWADILTCMGGHFESIAKAYSGHGDRRLMP